MDKIMTRGVAIGTSKESCVYCLGTGVRRLRYDREAACNCSYRKVFRACLNRYNECGLLTQVSTISWDTQQGPKGRCIYSRKAEEFRADFCIIARRYLSEIDLKIFTYHFLLGADWKLCRRELHIDRGTFFHAIYAIEQRLGRAFCQVTPYALYPLDEYFGGTISKFDGAIPRDLLFSGARELVVNATT